MAKKEKEATADYGKMIEAFGEASKLSISFVLFPVIFLLVGVWLDKKFSTVPIFIIAGVVLGIVLFVYQVRITIKKLNELHNDRPGKYLKKDKRKLKGL